MTRISKEPSVRINEILDAAEGLFYAKGFGETSVRDIVASIGVAQGTFYNYFTSKEAVAEAIADRHLAKIYHRIEDIADSVRIPPNKMEMVVYSIFNSLRKGDGWIFDFLADGHMYLLDRFIRLAQVRFAPFFKKIINEGNQSGYFKVSYPDEVLDYISAVLTCICHSLYKNLSADQLKRRMGTAERMINAALGVEKERLHLMI